MIFKSTVISFLTSIRECTEPRCLQSIRADFKHVPPKIEEASKEIKLKQVVKGLNQSSFSPRIEGDAAPGAADASLLHDGQSKAHVPKQPAVKAGGGRAGNGGVSLHPLRQTKIYFLLLCMGDPANGVINLGSHLARLRSPPTPFLGCLSAAAQSIFREPGI